MREGERERAQAREWVEEETDSLLGREPLAGLDPRTPDHDLSGRQMPNLLSHPELTGVLIAEKEKREVLCR